MIEFVLGLFRLSKGLGFVKGFRVSVYIRGAAHLYLGLFCQRAFYTPVDGSCGDIINNKNTLNSIIIDKSTIIDNNNNRQISSPPKKMK